MNATPHKCPCCNGTGKMPDDPDAVTKYVARMMRESQRQQKANRRKNKLIRRLRERPRWIPMDKFLPWMIPTLARSKWNGGIYMIRRCSYDGDGTFCIVGNGDIQKLSDFTAWLLTAKGPWASSKHQIPEPRKSAPIYMDGRRSDGSYRCPVDM